MSFRARARNLVEKGPYAVVDGLCLGIHIAAVPRQSLFYPGGISEFDSIDCAAFQSVVLLVVTKRNGSERDKIILQLFDLLDIFL